MAVCLVSGMMLAGTPAMAQSESPDAQALFDEAKVLLRAEQVDQACDKLVKSQELEPAVGTLGLLAFCREQQGRSVTAWRTYLEAAQAAKAVGDKRREQVALERAAALEPGLSRVRIHVDEPPDGLVITRNGEQVAPERWGEGVPTDPGPVEVSATAPGYEKWSVRLELESGVLAVRIPKMRPVPGSQAPGESESRVDHVNVPALIVGGAGVVLLGVGSYFGLRALSKNGDSKEYCTDNRCEPAGGALRDEAKSAATVSTVAVGLGLVGVAVGTYLFVSGSGDEKADEHGVVIRVTPELGPGHAGFGVGGSF